MRNNSTPAPADVKIELSQKYEALALKMQEIVTGLAEIYREAGDADDPIANAILDHARARLRHLKRECHPELGIRDDDCVHHQRRGRLTAVGGEIIRPCKSFLSRGFC